MDIIRNIHLVWLNGIVVLDDYIKSLNIFNKIINLVDFCPDKFHKSNDIYVFTQMYIDPNRFPENIYSSERFIYLNVEMVTEQKRWEHIQKLINKNVRIADYSMANINFIKKNLPNLKEIYTHEFIYLPYQYNIRETYILENKDRQYKYDIGIINAIITKSDTVNPELTYKRTLIYEKIMSMNFNCINIVGWNDERDKIIKQCKIIINIHNFEPYKVYEHIRCDRLIFSNKLIISEKSIYAEDLDIFNCILWKDYDKIIDYIKIVLDDFDTYQNQTEKISKKDIIANRIQILKDNYERMLKIKS